MLRPLNARNRHWAAALVFAVATVVYLATNHLHLTAPHLLPMTWVDAGVPFIPGTVWIYNTDYFFFISVYALLSSDLDALNKYCLSFLALIVASGLIFMVWPTVYPRDLFPLPATLDAATAGSFALLRRLDTPANCCPSLHVSGVTLALLAFMDRRRPARSVLFFAWGALIVLSTLTTKQHYVIDVVAGAGLAAVFYRLFEAPLGFTAASSTVEFQ